MEVKQLIKKSILPLVMIIFWLWMVSTIMQVADLSGLYWILFLSGLPFGIFKMYVLLIPRGYDIGGTIGILALSIIMGGLIGSIALAGYFIRAIYVLIKFVVVKIK